MLPETLSAPESRSRYRNLIFASPVWKNPVYAIGLIMIAVSLIIYHVSGIFVATSRSNPFGYFGLNYLLTFVYFVILLARGSLRRGRKGVHPFFLFLILFLISAYALNREMSIFDKSLPWFSAIEAVVCINYVAFIFFDRIPQALKIVMTIVAGVAMVVFAYLALYLLPIYIIGFVGFFVMGISLHTFVPLLFCIYTIVLLKKQENINWKLFIAGIIIPVVFIAAYAISWNIHNKRINAAYKKSEIKSNYQLPSWVNIAREIPNSFITEKILKTEIVYDVPDLNRSSFFWRVPGMNFGKVYHDPLVMISSLFSGSVKVPAEDRISILKSIYDARHEAQERLWSGENLITEKVTSTVKLWPDLRIGYTELEITTGNVAGPNFGSGNEEAIYTFHLPEGGVVTSLSLWINGKEEKSILTTKAKADSAYKTIVGREFRDPSVVHWQEGNTVSLRVFPVSKGQNRQFKIGITAPLAYDGKNLVYKNIHFQGPSANDAEQNIAVDLGNTNTDADLPRSFSRKDNMVSRKGHFSNDWLISIPAPELSNAAFSFNNFSYGISRLPAVARDFSPVKVYMDINSSWDVEECERVYHLIQKNKEVYVDDNGKITALTAQNKTDIFKKLTRNNFSLFPFYAIGDDEPTLVISKSTEQSPTIDDLKNSTFFTESNNALQKHRNIYLFNLGTTLSPYLKSLKEFCAFQYDTGDEDDLSNIILSKQFAVAPESDNAISVHEAGIQITRSNTPSSSRAAPDHLMRLYAYNHILQRAGISVLNDQLNDTTLMDEAAEANIVSPFSSLVVLESQADYDRFDIKASKNSLENASIKSKGAVPEPHEWALIVLVVLLLFALKFRPQLLLIRKR